MKDLECLVLPLLIQRKMLGSSLVPTVSTCNASRPLRIATEAKVETADELETVIHLIFQKAHGADNVESKNVCWLR